MRGMMKKLLKRAISASMKPGWRIFGEMWAALAGWECWRQSRPCHVCPECNEWMPRWHFHGPDNDYDTEENRHALMVAMRSFPDFGLAMIDTLRDDPDFAEFLVLKYQLPEKPKIERKYPVPHVGLKNDAMIDHDFGNLWEGLAD